MPRTSEVARGSRGPACTAQCSGRAAALGLGVAALLAGAVALAGCGGRAARIEPAPVGPEHDAGSPGSERGSEAVRAGETDATEAVPDRPAGTIHVVRPGETLWRIARTYGVSLELLAEVNGLTDVTRIAAGQRLLIPGADRPRSIPPVARDPGPPAAGRPEGAWIWPVTGRLSSRFGARRSRGSHEGVDILVPVGTPVVAARGGQVAFSGRRRGYGKVVILEHAGGFKTLYAHNAENLVRTGERIVRGEILARSGQTGNATAPHVHFELQRDGKAVDPLLYLPPP